MKSEKVTPILRVLLLLLLPIPTLASDPCSPLLIPRQEVEQLIEQRTAPLRAGTPELINRDGSRADILEGINRELSKPILDSSKRIALKHIEDLTSAWSKAAKEHIRLANDEFKKTKQQIGTDADGLPETPLIQNNRQAALNAKAKSGKMALSEFEQQTAQVAIEMLRKKYIALIKNSADQAIRAAETDLQTSLNRVSPDWNIVGKSATPILDRLKRILTSNFPIDRALQQGTKASLQAQQLLEAPIPSTPTAQVNANGVPEIIVKEVGVRAYYDAELGTVVIESSKGMLPNPQGLLFVVNHGAGTTRSNASSWKYILKKFFDTALNAIAMNLPMAGIGMDMGGLKETLAYEDFRLQTIRQRAPPTVNEPAQPLVELNRSASGTKGYAHALFYDNEGQGPVDAYILSSFSNPMTLKLQTENVFKQVALGLYRGVIPEALKNAELISDELMEELNRLQASNPDALKDFGDNLLFQQGNDDADGGPTVLEDLDYFVTRYAPRAHVYRFENPLLKYNIPHFEKLAQDSWEGTHFLYTNQSNMTREGLRASINSLRIRRDKGLLSREELNVLEAFEAIDAKVPDQDLPAPGDQHFEAVGTMYGFFDYLSQSKSSNPAMKKAAASFSKYRDHLTGGKTYLEFYAEKNGISAQDLAAAKPGRASRTERLKRVLEFWNAEAVKSQLLDR